MKNKQVIVSFDKTEHTSCESVRPEKYDDFKGLKDTPVIARGAGLSYCNAGASGSATVVDMSRMNRIIDFRPDQESITVEAGLTIGELHNFLISKGFILPVLPGYPTITIGGCIGFNVHGKSEFKVGTFGNWVRSLVLFHPTKGEMFLSPEQNPDLFNLTIGGMGFTGIILSATLKISKLPGNRLHVEQRKASSASEAVKVMTESSSDYEFVYSWNNFNCYDNSFGKGFVYLEKYEEGKSRATSFRERLKLSYKLPAIQNPFFTRMMCSVYYLMGSMKSTRYNLDISSGSFPIYGKEIYYNLFGRKGFREYQVLLPTNRCENAF
jgi:decaprenylphospho-beta-D-ribofuranose 2-oxidase